MEGATLSLTASGLTGEVVDGESCGRGEGRNSREDEERRNVERKRRISSSGSSSLLFRVFSSPQRRGEGRFRLDFSYSQSESKGLLSTLLARLSSFCWEW